MTQPDLAATSSLAHPVFASAPSSQPSSHSFSAQPSLVSLTSPSGTSSATSSASLAADISTAINQVEQVILGKKDQVRLMFVALLSGGHVLLDDTPGMGKTTLARAMASVLGVDLRRVQFTSDLMPSDIVGVGIPTQTDGHYTGMRFQPGPIFSHFLLADEINRASPRTQSALLEAMAEYQVTVDGVSHHLPSPFWVIATQNPVDFSGTFPLPESQMDRFLFRMALGYPDEESEMGLLLGQNRKDLIERIKPILSAQDLLQAQSNVSRQTTSEPLVRYLHRLILASRQHNDITTGLSPRAGLSILHAAQAQSWLAGRDHVTPDDIQAVFVPASAHRLTMNHHDFALRQAAALEILKSTPCP